MLLQHSFDVVRRALVAYKAKHGHLNVPREFTRTGEAAGGEVAAQDPPVKLGKVLYDIRHKGTYAEHREELIALGECEIVTI